MVESSSGQLLAGNLASTRDSLGDRSITVFGGSRVRPGSAEYDEALELGRLLAAEGFVVVNGGYGGVMEATHRGAKEADGHTIGYTVELLAGRAVNPWADREERSETLLERLERLTQDADAFIALGGGIGTLLEVALVWNLAQLDARVRRPIILVGQPWQHVVEVFAAELQVQPRDFERISVVESVEVAVRRVREMLSSAG